MLLKTVNGEWIQGQVLETILRIVDIQGKKLFWEIFRSKVGFVGWEYKYQHEGEKS